jgi:hypothetical protein
MTDDVGPRLVPELIPEPLWKLSAANLLPRAAWQAIRRDSLTAFDERCVACGFAPPEGKGLYCDELWNYNEDSGTVTLVGFRMLCRACSDARHFGRAGREETRAHLAEVNGLDEAGAARLQDAAREEWDRRSQMSWSMGVAAELLDRYPALSVLVGLGGRPGDGQRRL